jgi:lipopolysaccharide exporter
LMPLSFFTKKSSSFSGNVLKLMTGATFAQALGILVAPIVTRLFAPEAFGIAALFLSITAIIGVIVCLRYELAIMLPKTDEEATNIVAVSLCSVILITIVSALLVFFGSDFIVRLIKAPELKNYLWLIPLFVFFSGVSAALNSWNSRTKHFGRLSVIQIISSVITQATKLTAGFAGFVSGGVLILTTLLGSVVSTSMLGEQIWKDDKKLFISNVRWQKIRAGFVRFRKFPLIDTWGGLLNTVSWQLPALMLSSFFSLSVVGFYALGLTVLQRPLSIISGSLSQVFYQRASEEKNIKGNNAALVENLMDKLMFVGILPTAMLAMVGEELFAVVFGARWAEAGRYTQILAPWVFFWFISSPLSALFSVYERQGAALSVHSLIFITRVISLYIGGIYQNIYLALGLFSATGIAAYAFVAAWNIRLAQANEKRILLNFFKYSIYSLPVLLCLFLLKYLCDFSPLVILSSAFLMVAIYLIIFKNKIKNQLAKFDLPWQHLEKEGGIQ